MRRIPPSRARRAVFLAEVAAAGLMIALAMAMIVRLLGWTASQRRSAERRGWAIQEAANAMEAIAARPFASLTPEALASTALSPPARDVLPGGRIEVAVSDDAPMKRIDLAVRWKGASGMDEAPVRVTAWVANKGDAR